MCIVSDLKTNSWALGFIEKQNKTWFLDLSFKRGNIEERMSRIGFLKYIMNKSFYSKSKKWQEMGERAIRSNEERFSKEVYGVLSVKLKVEWAPGREEVTKIGYIQVTTIWQDWVRILFKQKRLLFLYMKLVGRAQLWQ